MLSGYVGSAEVGAAILDAVAEVKRANPRALYCCDPVIGDVGRGAFVPPEIAEFMRRRAVPAADIVTPNHFELEQLTGRTVRSLAAALAAIEELRGLGPRVVLVTSLATDETPADAIDLVACDAAGRHRLRTPRLPIAAHGAGDAIAALFLAHYLRSGSAAEALSRRGRRDLRRSQAHRGSGRQGNAADRGAGRTGEPQHELPRRTIVREGKLAVATVGGDAVIVSEGAIEA